MLNGGGSLGHIPYDYDGDGVYAHVFYNGDVIYACSNHHDGIHDALYNDNAPLAHNKSHEVQNNSNVHSM
jgi:hypothetical protein